MKNLYAKTVIKTFKKFSSVRKFHKNLLTESEKDSKIVPDVEHYSYIIVRNDLPSNAQVAVQAAHALAESIRHGNVHGSIVLLAVENESSLILAGMYLRAKGVKIYEFREADLNNSVTAICTESIVGERRLLLKDFNLYVDKV